MSAASETPEASGEVEASLHVVVVSSRLELVGTGADVEVAHDVADLLVALDDEHRWVVLFDARAPSIELEFFGRLARDFPMTVAILVRGGGEAARAVLFANGVFRAR